MKKQRVEEVEIVRIHIDCNRRTVKPAKAKAIADSILEIGLQHPVGVTTDMRLIHGRHRIEAYRMLGWLKIPAIIHELDALHAELAELDENLQRSELSALESSRALARRKKIYEALHPDAKRGTAGGKASGAARRGDEQTTDCRSFTEDTAAKTGRSQRTIQRDVAIADGIPDDVADIIANTPISDNKSELRKLSLLDDDDQREVAEKLASGEAETVDEALGDDAFEPPKRAKKADEPQPLAELIAATRESWVEFATDHPEYSLEMLCEFLDGIKDAIRDTAPRT